MKKLRDIVEAVKSGTLYHGTSRSRLARIMSSNRLHTAADHIAWTTPDRKEADFYARKHGKNGVVIHFSPSLSSHPKVKHMDDEGALHLKDNVSPGLNNIKDHITKVTRASRKTKKEMVVANKIKFHERELKKYDSVKKYKALPKHEQKKWDRALVHHQGHIERLQDQQ